MWISCSFLLWTNAATQQFGEATQGAFCHWTRRQALCWLGGFALATCAGDAMQAMTAADTIARAADSLPALVKRACMLDRQPKLAAAELAL